MKNLTELKTICIESTDIDSGLEYLPNSLNEAQYDTDTEVPNINRSRVFCSPKKRPGSKVAKIKEQLRPYNYDLKAWKLVNKKYPDLVKQRDELLDKIREIESELDQVKIQELENFLTRQKSTSQEIIAELERKVEVKETELTKQKEEIARLEKQLESSEQENITLNSLLSEEKNKNRVLSSELLSLKKHFLQIEIQEIKKDCYRLLNEKEEIKVKFNELLQEIEIMVKDGQENNPYARKLISLKKESLWGNLETSALEKICELKRGLTELEIYQEVKLESKVETATL